MPLPSPSHNGPRVEPERAATAGAPQTAPHKLALLSEAGALALPCTAKEPGCGRVEREEGAAAPEGCI